jgi:hypothetical protein
MERQDPQQQQRACRARAILQEENNQTPHFPSQVLPALIMLSSEAVVLLQASFPPVPGT